MAFGSRLLHTEVCATLGAAQRSHTLTANESNHALASWEQIWRRIVPVEFTVAVQNRAANFALGHHLCGADAVHLASAHAPHNADITLVTWDRKLHTAAKASGLAVLPDNV